MSVIMEGKPSKAVSYIEWLRQSKGQPTFRSMLEADLRDAIADANDLGHFFLLMEHKGYEIHHGDRLGFRLRGQERSCTQSAKTQRFQKKISNAPLRVISQKSKPVPGRRSSRVRSPSRIARIQNTRDFLHYTKEKTKIAVLAKHVDAGFEVSRSSAPEFIANSGNKKALNTILERQEKHSASITINDNSYHSETGLPKDPRYFECSLSNDLKTSIRRMEESWEIEDNGGKDYH